MHKSRFIVAFLLSSAFTAAPVLAGPLDAATASAIHAAAQRAIASGSAKSVSVSVARNGGIVYSQAFGAGTPDSEYFIGSATKTFTAVSVMQLVQSHRLALGDKLATFYPQFPHAAEITVEELLTHTSGIPDFLPIAMNAGSTQTPVTPDRIIADAAKLPLDFTPGSAWNYSNTGYAVLGRIVEKISGQTLAQYETAHIFKPAGMAATAVAHAALPAHAAAPFEAPGSELSLYGTMDPSWLYAVGDIVSTSSDIARFDIALLNGKLVKKATLQRMLQPAPFASTVLPNWQDGLGLFVAKFGTEVVAGHHGGEPGYRADNEMVPARSLAIVILGNGSYDTSSILKPALTQLFPRAAAYAQAHPPAAPPDPAPALTEQSAAFLRDLIAGKATASQLTPAVSAAFSSQTLDAFKTRFATYGALKSVTFSGTAYSSGYRIYTYKAVFASGKIEYPTVVYDKDGKIAGLQHFQ